MYLVSLINKKIWGYLNYQVKLLEKIHKNLKKRRNKLYSNKLHPDKYKRQQEIKDLELIILSKMLDKLKYLLEIVIILPL